MSIPDDLIAQVTSLLNARRGEWQQIASDPAAGVSYSWLSKFANGHIDNPGYLTLRKLRDYLTATPSSTVQPQEARHAA